MVDSSPKHYMQTKRKDDTWFDAQNAMRCLYPKMR
jgi:hypothetical protein